MNSDKPSTKAHIVLGGYLTVSAPTPNVLAPRWINFFPLHTNFEYIVLYFLWKFELLYMFKEYNFKHEAFFWEELREQ
jgi:hypothetical protein